VAGVVNEGAPWPLPLPWIDIQRGAAPMHLAAAPEVLKRVATAVGAVAVIRLEADLTARPWLDGVEISGRIEAVVTRTCGVTLEAFDEAVDEPLLVRVVPAGSPNAPEVRGGEVAIDPEGDDLPDELIGDTLDIGAYVVEHLALALSPFPRRPGAVFEPPEPLAHPSPFGVLERLKPQPEEG
jgi:hypothetical protein